MLNVELGVALVFEVGPLVELEPDLKSDLEPDNSLIAVSPPMTNLTTDLLDKMCLRILDFEHLLPALNIYTNRNFLGGSLVFW